MAERNWERMGTQAAPPTPNTEREAIKRQNPEKIFRMEEEDQNRDETGAKIYTGLPVTSAALIFPAVLLIHMLIRADLTFLYFGVMLITGGLFISKIQIKKPQNKGIATMIFFGAVECVVLIFALKFFEKVKFSYKHLNFVVFYENTMEIFVHKF